MAVQQEQMVHSNNTPGMVAGNTKIGLLGRDAKHLQQVYFQKPGSGTLYRHDLAGLPGHDRRAKKEWLRFEARKLRKIEAAASPAR